MSDGYVGFQPFNPLDPRDRAERNRERVAAFRRLDMMGAVALAMTVFVALAMFARSLALAFLITAMFGPVMILALLMALNVFVEHRGPTRSWPVMPAPWMLVAATTCFFFAAIRLGTGLGVLFAAAGIAGLIWNMRRGATRTG
jgi:hypothetical protein